MLDQRRQRLLARVGAGRERAVVGRLLRQFSRQFRFEMSFGEMSVEVALVLRDASAVVALDGKGTFHAGGWGLDEVVPGWNVGVRSRVRLGLSWNRNIKEMKINSNSNLGY
jgi:hypothetical protein